VARLEETLHRLRSGGRTGDVPLVCKIRIARPEPRSAYGRLFSLSGAKFCKLEIYL